MASTKDKLKTHDPSRHHGSLFGTPDFIALLDRHFGENRPHTQSPDAQRLLTAIGAAATEEVRNGAGYISLKGSKDVLRAMAKMKDDSDLLRALRTCDMGTYARIMDAHAELCYERRGVPIVDTPAAATLPEDDLAAAQLGGDAFIRAMHVLNATPDSAPILWPNTELSMGVEGLREAILHALEIAEKSRNNLGADPLDVWEANRRPGAGNREKPHLDALATACAVFWGIFGSSERQSFEKFSSEEYMPPRARFARDVFKLAGIEIKRSRVNEIMGGADFPN